MSSTMHKEDEYMQPLREECQLLYSYLTNDRPSDYIIDKYIDAHGCSNLYSLNKSARFDRLLLKLAKKHLILLKLTDAYTSIFRRSSIVRKKIILMLALLESNGSSHYHVDPVLEYHKVKFLIKFIYKIQCFIFPLILSAMVFWPLVVVSLLKEKLDD